MPQPLKTIFTAIALLFFAVLLTIIFTFPSIKHLDNQMIGDGGDAYQYAGFQQLVAENLSRGQWPYAFSTTWRYPFGFEFSRGFDSVLITLSGGILLLINHQPVLTFNLIIYAAFIYNFLSAYWLFQKFSKNKLLVLLTSTGYAFSFYNLARSHGHANLLLSGSFTLVLASFINFYQQTKRRNFIYLCLTILVLSFSSAQYFVLLGIVTFTTLLLAWFFYQTSVKSFFLRLLKIKSQLLPVLGIFSIAWLIFFSPYVSAVLQNNFEGRDKSINLSPHLLDFILPARFLEFPLAQLNPYPLDSNSVEYVVTFDLIFLLILLVFLPMLLKKRFSRFLLTLFLLFLLISFGRGNPGQPFFIYHYLTFFPFTAIDEPGRFSLIANLLLLLLVAIGIEEWRAPVKKKNILLGFSLLLIIFIRLPFAGYTLSTPYLGPGVKLVKELPGQAVLDIPADSSANGFYPFWYEKRVVTGYPHFLANTADSLAFLKESGVADSFTCGSNPAQFNAGSMDLLWKKLKSYDVQVITVRQSGTLIWPRCYGVLERLNQYFPQEILAHAEAEEPYVSHDFHRFVNVPLAGKLFFPQAGTVQILGLTILPAPTSPEDLRLNFQGQTITFRQENWRIEENNGRAEALLDFYGYDELKRSVQAGDVFTVESAGIGQDLGVLSFWYVYQPDEESEKVYPVNPWMTKLYNDDELAVYQLR